MTSVFFACLQCGVYLKASNQMVVNEVSMHMCQNAFDSKQFDKGIAVLHEVQKMKHVPLSPPLPPPMPAVPLYVENKKGSLRNKGQIHFIFHELYYKPSKDSMKSFIHFGNMLFLQKMKSLHQQHGRRSGQPEQFQS